MRSIQKKIKGDSFVRDFFVGGVAVALSVSFLSLLASHIASDTLRVIDVMIASPFALVTSLFLVFFSWFFLKGISTRVAFLFLLTFIGVEILLIAFLVPQLRYTPGNASFGDWISCHPFRVIEEKETVDFSYRETRNNVCIPRNFCRKFQPSISCKDPERWGDGYVPILNVQPKNFRANRYEELSGKKLRYWIIEIGNASYFWSVEKGDGRFFSVDKNSLEYLGRDLFRDKDGFIYRNTRLPKSESSPERIDGILHPSVKSL